MARITEVAAAAQRSPLRDRLERHLGGDCAMLPVVSQSFAPYDHANVQVALSAYLQAEGRSHELVGLTGHQRHFESLSDLVQMGQPIGVQIGSVDLVTLPIGPDATLACVQFGLFLIDDWGVPLVALLRGPMEFGPQQTVTLELLCPDQARANGLLAEIRRLMVERNVFRRQVVSFGESHLGHVGLGPVVFHRRPELPRDALVLPDGVLELVERQVLGIARHRERLRASGQHVMRGLLLYGPPGNGKTLTVRYLVSQTRDQTVLLLTGGGLHLLRPACALARMLEPALVVLEDVDLVLDGIDEDADVAFVLTTNRADVLEPALAARPGRVDLAVEIGLPDENARRRLIALYGSGVTLLVEDLQVIITRTAGVAASFIKELVRKAALLAAEGADGAGPLTVTDQYLQEALGELLEERSTLTRVLLGGVRPEELGRRRDVDWLIANTPDSGPP